MQRVNLTTPHLVQLPNNVATTQKWLHAGIKPVTHCTMFYNPSRVLKPLKVKICSQPICYNLPTAPQCSYNLFLAFLQPFFTFFFFYDFKNLTILNCLLQPPNNPTILLQPANSTMLLQSAQPQNAAELLNNCYNLQTQCCCNLPITSLLLQPLNNSTMLLPPLHNPQC